MTFLKQLPIAYKGELHDVKLINFSVEAEEVLPDLPPQIKPRIVDGRALISMVNVKLKNMRPDFLTAQFGFDYQHIAFRMVLEDEGRTDDPHKALFFLKSFTDKSMTVKAGQLLTNYRLETATINDEKYLVELKKGTHFLHYAWCNQRPEKNNPRLKKIVVKLDRAYAVSNEKVFVTQIKRKHWPIEWIDCYHLQTNFFKTARLEGAFQITEVIDYHWKAPTPLAFNHVTENIPHEAAALVY